MNISKLGWSAGIVLLIALVNAVLFFLGYFDSAINVLPLILGDAMLVLVAAAPLFIARGPNSHITLAGYTLPLLLVAAIDLALMLAAPLTAGAHTLLCIIYLVMLFIYILLITAARDTSRHIESMQDAAATDRIAVQQLAARIDALIRLARDTEKRAILERAARAVAACPSQSRADLTPLENETLQALDRIEALCEADAGTDELEAEVRRFTRSLNARNASLRLRR